MKILCCDVEPVDMGRWPLMGSDRLINRYHCRICNRFFALIVEGSASIAMKESGWAEEMQKAYK